MQPVRADHQLVDTHGVIAEADAHGCDARFDHLSISAVAFDVGLRDLSHFNRSFRRRFAQTPSELRASQRDGRAALELARAVARRARPPRSLA
ncbi:MAG TPA: helix-turn-helix domain-containing protein [Polyangiaceae bacterium]|nr:helix-turn-helix domain-containing protein [Polyangiaceae bacterium]